MTFREAQNVSPSAFLRIVSINNNNSGDYNHQWSMQRSTSVRSSCNYNLRQYRNRNEHYFAIKNNHSDSNTTSINNDNRLTLSEKKVYNLTPSKSIAQVHPKMRTTLTRSTIVTKIATIITLCLLLINVASLIQAQDPTVVLKDIVPNNNSSTDDETNIDNLVKDAFDRPPMLATSPLDASVTSPTTTSIGAPAIPSSPPTPTPFDSTADSPAPIEPDNGSVLIHNTRALGGVSPVRNESREKVLEVVRQAHQNLLESVIVTNKTRAFLSCETGEMIVKMNFTEPFAGVAYADYDRSSPCRFYGDSGTYYEMRLPLKGCGTRQEAPRLFINNIIVRFHRTLELEEDEIKTIVCRYPPPQAAPPPPPPRGPPEKIVELPPEPAKLVRYEPLFMIAGLLFFTLLLLGFGAGSYAVRKRTITPVHVLKPSIPPVDHNYFDTYLDTQSIVDTKDLTTLHKATHAFAPVPAQIDTKILSETYVTTLHEIDTVDQTIHNKEVQLYRAPQLDVQTVDDAYLTNVDDVEIEDLQTTHKRSLMLAPRPKLEIKNIEQTFITNVHEIDETQETIGRKQTRRLRPASTGSISESSGYGDRDDYYRTETLEHYVHNIDDDVSEQLDDCSQSKATNLSTKQLNKCYQSIVETIEQIMIDETSTSQSKNTIDVSNRREYESKFGQLRQYMEQIERDQRVSLYYMLTTDDTFKNLVLESSDERSIRDKLRHNPLYKNRLTSETWNAFTESLVYAWHSQETIAREPERLTTHQRVTGRRDNNQLASEQQWKRYESSSANVASRNTDHYGDDNDPMSSMAPDDRVHLWSEQHHQVEERQYEDHNSSGKRSRRRRRHQASPSVLSNPPDESLASSDDGHSYGGVHGHENDAYYDTAAVSNTLEYEDHHTAHRSYNRSYR